MVPAWMGSSSSPACCPPWLAELNADADGGLTLAEKRRAIVMVALIVAVIVVCIVVATAGGGAKKPAKDPAKTPSALTSSTVTS